LILGLLGILILSACAPPSTHALPQTQTSAPEPAAPESVPSKVSEVVPSAVPVETEPPAEEVVVQPTSRGNELEATDPTTVNIVSGEPQLIEFFAFW
jgi:hypothetical protein